MAAPQGSAPAFLTYTADMKREFENDLMTITKGGTEIIPDGTHVISIDFIQLLPYFVHVGAHVVKGWLRLHALLAESTHANYNSWMHHVLRWIDTLPKCIEPATVSKREEWLAFCIQNPSIVPVSHRAYATKVLAYEIRVLFRAVMLRLCYYRGADLGFVLGYASRLVCNENQGTEIRRQLIERVRQTYPEDYTDSKKQLRVAVEMAEEKKVLVDAGELAKPDMLEYARSALWVNLMTNKKLASAARSLLRKTVKINQENEPVLVVELRAFTKNITDFYYAESSCWLPVVPKGLPVFTHRPYSEVVGPEPDDEVVPVQLVPVAAPALMSVNTVQNLLRLATTFATYSTTIQSFCVGRSLKDSELKQLMLGLTGSETLYTRDKLLKAASLLRELDTHTHQILTSTRDAVATFWDKWNTDFVKQSRNVKTLVNHIARHLQRKQGVRPKFIDSGEPPHVWWIRVAVQLVANSLPKDLWLSRYDELQTGLAEIAREEAAEIEVGK